MSQGKNCFAAIAGLMLVGQAALAFAQLPDFTPLVEQAAPAVVNISTKQKPSARSASSHMPDLEGLPPIFREFFEHRIPDMPNDPNHQRPEAQSLGSGFIISADGYVLTNNHVVAGADEIVVRLPDRSELQARLVGADPRTDVALLKVESDNLPSVKLGDSGALKPGEWVLAIGSPFGFDHTVTAGIVSATGRSLPNESYVPFIQTDVAINPGNSGGPLFNLSGEVVGINSQIFTRSGGFMGLSFAIPINVAMDVANQLRTDGKVSRGWLGVVIQEVNKDLAESFGLDRPAGALVAQVLDGGPAAKAGLRVGDVILSLDDQPIIRSSELPQRVGAIRPGREVRLGIARDGERETLDIEIGALPEEDEILAGGRPAAPRASNRLGVRVAELTMEQKRALDLPGGVIVSEVLTGPAELIGLRPGDVITHLNNQAITSAKTFGEVVEQLPNKRSVSMRVLREGRASFITFKLTE